MGSKSSKPEPKPTLEVKQEPKPLQNNYVRQVPPEQSTVSISKNNHAVIRVSEKSAVIRVSEKSAIPATPKFAWNELFRDLSQITTNFESLVLNADQSLRSVQAPEKSKRNPYLFDIYTSENVTYIDLEPYDTEYHLVQGMITNKRNFKVDSIQKIVNPFLETAFYLKKAQKESQFANVEEKLLFHGTKHDSIDTICEMNFNWRLCKTHKYGRGISFSPNATYASNYSDKNVYHKVMIVAKVLIGKSCQGDEFMNLPPHGFDTTRKDEGIVIVKFEDNEFYPVYKINYHLMDENVGRKVGTRRRVQPIYIDNFAYDYEYGSY